MNKQINEIMDSIIKCKESVKKYGKEWVIDTIKHPFMLSLNPLPVRKYIEQAEGEEIWDMYCKRCKELGISPL